MHRARQVLPADVGHPIAEAAGRHKGNRIPQERLICINNSKTGHGDGVLSLASLRAQVNYSEHAEEEKKKKDMIVSRLYCWVEALSPPPVVSQLCKNRGQKGDFCADVFSPWRSVEL